MKWLDKIKEMFGGSTTKDTVEGQTETSENEQKPKLTVYSLGTGKVEPIAKCVDGVFNEKMVGDGIVFTPRDSIIYAPVTGKITMVAETKHAINFKVNEYELMLHIGIDTVKLAGKGITLNVKVGDEVKQGQQIANLDLEVIKNEAKSIQSPLIVLNESMKEGDKINLSFDKQLDTTSTNTEIFQVI